MTYEHQAIQHLIAADPELVEVPRGVLRALCERAELATADSKCISDRAMVEYLREAIAAERGRRPIDDDFLP